MKLAFEVTRTIRKQPTGITRYARQLIGAVAGKAGNTQIELFCKLPSLAKRKYWLKFDNIRSRVHLENLFPVFDFPDVIHGLDGYVPEWKNVKRVVTIHDIYPLVKDHDSPPGFREMISTGYAEALRVADLVVTVSENTRSDLIDYFQVDGSKIVTVYPGSGLSDLEEPPSEITPPQDRPSRSYMIFLGAISGRKNTERIVRAYARSRIKDDFDLLLIGSLAYKGESTIEAVTELGLEGRVKICGYVPDDEMAEIFRNASGLVFPTLYEGFGFPILEAMKLGIPVLTSNIGSAVEVAGGHAILADPYDVDSIATGIDMLLDKSSEDLASAKSHAMSFTWEKCAVELLNIYKQLVEKD